MVEYGVFTAVPGVSALPPGPSLHGVQELGGDHLILPQQTLALLIVCTLLQRHTLDDAALALAHTHHYQLMHWMDKILLGSPNCV